MIDDVISDMKRGDALFRIERSRKEAHQYIQETKPHLRKAEYRILIDNLFDIIDDYERGEAESARQKIRSLRAQLDDGELIAQGNRT
jgi:hypothetical protein